MELNTNVLCDLTGKWIVAGQVDYIIFCMREKYNSMREEFVENKDSAGTAFVDVCLSTLDVFEKSFKKLPDIRDCDLESNILQ